MRHLVNSFPTVRQEHTRALGLPSSNNSASLLVSWVLAPSGKGSKLLYQQRDTISKGRTSTSPFHQDPSPQRTKDSLISIYDFSSKLALKKKFSLLNQIMQATIKMINQLMMRFGISMRQNLEPSKLIYSSKFSDLRRIEMFSSWNMGRRKDFFPTIKSTQSKHFSCIHSEMETSKKYW